MDALMAVRPFGDGPFLYKSPSIGLVRVQADRGRFEKELQPIGTLFGDRGKPHQSISLTSIAVWKPFFRVALGQPSPRKRADRGRHEKRADPHAKETQLKSLLPNIILQAPFFVEPEGGQTRVDDAHLCGRV